MPIRPTSGEGSKRSQNPNEERKLCGSPSMAGLLTVLIGDTTGSRWCGIVQFVKLASGRKLAVVSRWLHP